MFCNIFKKVKAEECYTDQEAGDVLRSERLKDAIKMFNDALQEARHSGLIVNLDQVSSLTGNRMPFRADKIVYVGARRVNIKEL